MSEDFATAAAAQNCFNDNPIALGVTTTQAGSSFTTGLLLAFGSHYIAA